ncbi:hypothetical protein PHET_07181 [Paragonimus heterotremus]|uniref:Uncharacterized protein n=1 Tax=Paragonimus heterotremus TaxID=100268 RepID=A0A8J4SX26_9TREM|nr:hypothetical protein PHET_07181 [Paragonimus heterotremus]
MYGTHAEQHTNQTQTINMHRIVCATAMAKIYKNAQNDSLRQCVMRLTKCTTSTEVERKTENQLKKLWQVSQYDANHKKRTSSKCKESLIIEAPQKKRIKSAAAFDALFYSSFSDEMDE